MDIIIVGCGRVGASLGKILGTPDNSVSIIDIDPLAFANLSSEFQGRTFTGQGFDEEVLLAAGIDSCDAFAAVTSLDNVNMMASEVARRLYRVPHVITRLIDPDRLDVYEQLGLDYICDTELVAESISARIRSRKSHHLDTFGEYEIMTFSFDAGGSVMKVRDVEALGDIEIMLFEHDEEVIKATPGMFLHDGDIVIAMVHASALPALSRHMRI